MLYRPVKPWRVTQSFGEDKCCTDGVRYVYKETHQTCPVGFKSLYSKMNGHNGIDVATYRWQPVYCACEGTVIEVETEIERGLGVGVLSKVGDKYYKHRYWHFIGINVQKGQTVEVGDLLGWADSTGYSTGDHLHFELKETDSLGRTKNNKNGYFGALDVDEYLYPAYAIDVAPVLKKLKETLANLIEVLAEKIRTL